MEHKQIEAILRDYSETGRRFAAVEGSESSHCCFSASIINVSEMEITNGYNGFTNLCECFEEAGANKIADALNLADLDLADRLVALTVDMSGEKWSGNVTPDKAIQCLSRPDFRTNEEVKEWMQRTFPA